MNNGLTDIENLKVKYFALQKRQLMVHNPEHIAAYNRLHDRVWSALLAIEDLGEAGRRAIEDMLTNEEPMIRFRAATRALAWNPHLAVPALGRLLTEQFPRRRGAFDSLLSWPMSTSFFTSTSMCGSMMGRN